jgi:hypothetical protein
VTEIARNVSRNDRDACRLVSPGFIPHQQGKSHSSLYNNISKISISASFAGNVGKGDGVGRSDNDDVATVYAGLRGVWVIEDMGDSVKADNKEVGVGKAGDSKTTVLVDLFVIE